jgi:hypothetical protein
MSDQFEGTGTALLFSSISMAVSLGAVAYAFPNAFAFFGLMPFALGALGFYHYVRARGSADSGASAHHAKLCTHFGLLAISIAGSMVAIGLVGVYFFMREY